jgi:hypothetical protein
MARKQDLRDLADANSVDYNESDTIADLEERLSDAGVTVPPEDATMPPAAANAPEELTDDQQAAAIGDDPDRQQAALGLPDGLIGQKVDPRPNEEYSLESGPESPSALDQAADAAELRVEDVRASAAGPAPAEEPSGE